MFAMILFLIFLIVYKNGKQIIQDILEIIKNQVMMPLFPRTYYSVFHYLFFNTRV